MARVAFASVLIVALAGCATRSAPPATLSAETAATDLMARSLQDARLQHFLEDNLGHRVEAPWDFETLSWVAFYYHPSLAVARAQWATARAGEASAAMKPNPTLTLTPGFATTRQPGVSPWFPAISLDFLQVSPAKRARLEDVARAQSEAARLDVLAAVWQVRGELRRALTEAGIAARRAAVLADQVQAQQKLVALIEQRVGAGGASATELSTARAGLLRAQAAANEAVSARATSRVRVAIALGMPLTALGDVDLPIPAPPPSMSAEALAAARNESLRSRADVLAALAKYQAAHASLELEVAKDVFDYHLGPGYQYDQGVNKWSLGLSVEIPLHHRNDPPIAEATAKRAEAAAQFSLVQAQALGAIETAAAAQGAASQQLEHARQLRRELQQQRERAQQRVELGAADQLELQLAAVDLATVETTLLDAESAAALAGAQLEEALQIPFPHLTALADRQRAQTSLAP